MIASREMRVVFIEGANADGAAAQTDVLVAYLKDGWSFLGMTPVTGATTVREENRGDMVTVGAASETVGTFLYFERMKMPSPETVTPSETAPGSKMNRSMRRRAKRA
jgi:hypothetical protein